MGFLKDNEFFLLMDIAYTGGEDPTKYPLMPLDQCEHRTLEELKQLRNAGIQTTMNFQTVRKNIEVAPGQFDWSYMDDYVNRATIADMKILLFTTTHGQPDWLPDEFFVKCEDGVHREALSPWNTEAQANNNEFTQKLINRYFSQNHCMIINSQLCVGETVLRARVSCYNSQTKTNTSKTRHIISI